MKKINYFERAILKGVVYVVIIAGLTSFWWIVVDHDPRPICRTTSWLQKPTDFRADIQYICPKEKDRPYKYVFESNNVKRFDLKAYLKARPEDMVYIWSADAEPPQSLIIFSDFPPNEKFIRWENSLK